MRGRLGVSLSVLVVDAVRGLSDRAAARCSTSAESRSLSFIPPLTSGALVRWECGRLKGSSPHPETCEMDDERERELGVLLVDATRSPPCWSDAGRAASVRRVGLRALPRASLGLGLHSRSGR